MRPLARSTVLRTLQFMIGLAAIDLTAAPRESITHLFAEANTCYQKGDYANAERLYLQLLDKGIDSGALYYNLGNACFKQKKLGDAIYCWKKTLQKLPADADARENLDLASLLVVDRVEVPPDPVPLRWMDGMVHRLTMSQDGWIAALLFAAANFLFSCYLISRHPRWAIRSLVASFGTACLAVLFGCSLAWKAYERNYRLEGVVVEQKADVRSGPGGDNVTVFTVHEGILLRVRGETVGWYQVSLPNGWSGWLPRNSVRVL